MPGDECAVPGPVRRRRRAGRGCSSSSSSASSALSGLAMLSRSCPSALMPYSSSAIPPSAITPAPMKNAIATCDSSPDSIILPNRNGPVMPPIAVPIA